MRRLRSLLFLLLPSMAAGILLGAYPGYKTYEFVWKDAAFCTSCHVHDYANIGWKQSSHGRLTTCHDCHHQPLHDYVREAFIMVTNPPKFPRDLKHTPNVPKDLCQACHLSTAEDRSTITGPLSPEDVDQLPKVDRLHLHRVHLAKKVKAPLPSHRSHGEVPERAITCVDCHGGVSNRAHNFSATDRSCIQCHEKIHQKGQIVKQVGCRSCHFQDFMVPIAPKQNPASSSPKAGS